MKPTYLALITLLLATPAYAQTSSSSPVRISIGAAATADKDAPVILVYEPAQSRGIRIRKREITVRARIDDQSPIRYVTVNDRPVDLDENGGFTITVPVRPGMNDVVIIAVDQAGNRSAKPIEIERTLDVDITGRYVALVIGIDDYKGRWTPLNNAVRDATTVAELLRTEYTFDEVTTLLDGEATRAGIIRTMENMQRTLSPEDNLLIYYAGHGYLDAFESGYWVPSDARTTSAVDFIPNPQVQRWIAGFRSKHTLLVADACFAGDLLRSGPTMRAEQIGTPEYYQTLHDNKSRRALTAGGVQPVQDSGVSDKHSVFAHFFLKALRDNNDPFIDASQLFAQIKPNVVNNALEQVPGYDVIHRSGDEGGEFIFVRRQ